MYVKIGDVDYTQLKQLKFAPEISLTGDSLPINEFSALIVTDDILSVGTWASLYDDMDNLWAKYWVTYAEHEDAQTVRLIAQSVLALLDRKTMPAVMYNGSNVGVLIYAMFASVWPGSVTVTPVVEAMTVTGFCPEQTARERLQWLLFASMASIKTFFSDVVEIDMVGRGQQIVPMEKTFWKPTITYRDYVTAVKVTSYSFTAGTPAQGDEYVTDANGDTYIVSRQDYTLSNPDAPTGAPDNVVEIKDVMLVYSGNVSAIASFLANYYFKRMDVTLDAVNNAEWMPAQKATVYTDEASIAQGYIKRCDFSFGVQARSRIELGASEMKQSAGLTIKYMYDTTQIGMSRHRFPVGYSYEIDNPYIIWEMNGHRYVFRPQEATVSGTMTSSSAVVNVYYSIALDLYDGMLHVVSVDDVEVSESGTETVTRTAVIA